MDKIADWQSRPPNVDRRMWKRFLTYLGSGTSFWTSEDGQMDSLVIARRPDARAVLLAEYDYLQAKGWRLDLRTLMPRFAYREWAGRDFFDGPGCGPRRGVVWRVGDSVTDFPVFEMDLTLSPAGSQGVGE